MRPPIAAAAILAAVITLAACGGAPSAASKWQAEESWAHHTAYPLITRIQSDGKIARWTAVKADIRQGQASPPPYDAADWSQILTDLKLVVRDGQAGNISGAAVNMQSAITTVRHLKAIMTQMQRAAHASG